MFKKLGRAIGSAGRRGSGTGAGAGLRVRFDVTVVEVQRLPQSVRKCRVVWARNAKVQMTDVKEARKGVAAFKQTLTQVAGLHKDKAGNLEPKEYTIKVQVPQGGEGGKEDRTSPGTLVTIGKATLDLSPFAADTADGQAETLPITFKVGASSSSGFIKLVITATPLMGGGAGDEDGMTEVSGMTGITSQHDGGGADQDLGGFDESSPRADRRGRALTSKLPPTREEDSPGSGSSGGGAASPTVAKGKKPAPRAAAGGDPFAKKVASPTKAGAAKPGPRRTHDDDDDEISNVGSDLSDEEDARPAPKKAAGAATGKAGALGTVAKSKPAEPQPALSDLKSSLFSKQAKKPEAAKPQAPPPPVVEDEDAARAALFSSAPAAKAPASKGTAATTKKPPLAPKKALASQADGDDEDALRGALFGATVKKPQSQPQRPGPKPKAADTDSDEDELGVTKRPGAAAVPTPATNNNGNNSGRNSASNVSLPDLQAQLLAARDRIADLERQLDEARDADPAELFAQLKDMEVAHAKELQRVRQEHAKQLADAERRVDEATRAADALRAQLEELKSQAHVLKGKQQQQPKRGYDFEDEEEDDEQGRESSARLIEELRRQVTELQRRNRELQDASGALQQEAARLEAVVNNALEATPHSPPSTPLAQDATGPLPGLAAGVQSLVAVLKQLKEQQQLQQQPRASRLPSAPGSPLSQSRATNQKDELFSMVVGSYGGLPSRIPNSAGTAPGMDRRQRVQQQLLEARLSELEQRVKELAGQKSELEAQLKKEQAEAEEVVAEWGTYAESLKADATKHQAAAEAAEARAVAAERDAGAARAVADALQARLAELAGQLAEAQAATAAAAATTAGTTSPAVRESNDGFELTLRPPAVQEDEAGKDTLHDQHLIQQLEQRIADLEAANAALGQELEARRRRTSDLGPRLSAEPRGWSRAAEAQRAEREALETEVKALRAALEAARLAAEQTRVQLKRSKSRAGMSARFAPLPRRTQSDWGDGRDSDASSLSSGCSTPMYDDGNADKSREGWTVARNLAASRRVSDADAGDVSMLIRKAPSNKAQKTTDEPLAIQVSKLHEQLGATQAQLVALQTALGTTPLLGGAGGGSGGSDDKVRQLEDRLRAAEAQSAVQDQEAARLHARLQAAEAQAAAHKKEAAQLRERLQAAEAQMASQQQEVTQLTSRVADLQQLLESQQTSLKASPLTQAPANASNLVFVTRRTLASCRAALTSEPCPMDGQGEDRSQQLPLDVALGRLRDEAAALLGELQRQAGAGPRFEAQATAVAAHAADLEAQVEQLQLEVAVLGGLQRAPAGQAHPPQLDSPRSTHRSVYADDGGLTLSALEQQLALAQEENVRLREELLQVHAVGVPAQLSKQRVSSKSTASPSKSKGDNRRPGARQQAVSSSEGWDGDSGDHGPRHPELERLRGKCAALEARCSELEAAADSERAEAAARLEAALQDVRDAQAALAAKQERGIAPSGNSAVAGDLASLQRKVAALTRENVSLAEQLDEANSARASFEKQIKRGLRNMGEDEMLEAVEAFENKYLKLRDRYKRLEADLTAEADELQAALQAARDEAAAAAAAGPAASRGGRGGASFAAPRELAELRAENEALVGQLVAKQLEAAQAAEQLAVLRRDLHRLKELNMRLAAKMTTLEAQAYTLQRGGGDKKKGGLFGNKRRVTAESRE